MRSRSLGLAALLLLAACGGATEPPVADGPVRSAGEDRGVRLTLEAERAAWRSGEAIGVAATLGHDGAGPLTVWGSGSGIVAFRVTRLGDGLGSGEPAWTADCVPHELPAGAPIDVPFAKSGGFSDDDPNAAFLRTYFAEPELTLPVGTWRIDAVAVGALGEGCSGPTLDLATSIEITVVD